jgi:hypothetical protein
LANAEAQFGGHLRGEVSRTGGSFGQGRHEVAAPPRLGPLLVRHVNQVDAPPARCAGPGIDELERLRVGGPERPRPLVDEKNPFDADHLVDAVPPSLQQDFGPGLERANPHDGSPRLQR